MMEVVTVTQLQNAITKVNPSRTDKKRTYGEFKYNLKYYDDDRSNTRTRKSFIKCQRLNTRKRQLSEMTEQKRNQKQKTRSIITKRRNKNFEDSSRDKKKKALDKRSAYQYDAIFW